MVRSASRPSAGGTELRTCIVAVSLWLCSPGFPDECPTLRFQACSQVHTLSPLVVAEQSRQQMVPASREASAGTGTDWVSAVKLDNTFRWSILGYLPAWCMHVVDFNGVPS